MKRLIAGIVCACAPAAAALAQEAINTDAATQPSLGQWVVRQQFSSTRFDGDPTGLGREIDEFTSSTLVSYGLARDISASVRLPLIYRSTEADAGDSKDAGLADVTATLKWRLFHEDTGVIDTVRFSLIGGLEVPTGNGLSSDGWDPFIGGVLTAITGRHGFNVAAQWKFTTDGEESPVRAGEASADLFRGDFAYLYRLDPAEYGPESDAATYLVLEVNALAETNGDAEALLAPGLLYEARWFALEASVQVPAWQGLDHRPEQDFTVTLGLRLLF
jgi:hypothetical protein